MTSLIRTKKLTGNQMEIIVVLKNLKKEGFTTLSNIMFILGGAGVGGRFTREKEGTN